MIDARYMQKIPNRAQPHEVYVPCSFWELVGACGLWTMADDGPCENQGDSEFASTTECETVAHYSRAYRVL